MGHGKDGKGWWRSEEDDARRTRKGGGTARRSEEEKGKGKKGEKGKAGAEAHMGPLEVPEDAAISASDRGEIEDETGVKVQIRYRAQWGAKGVTLSGPPQNMEEALRRTRRLLNLREDPSPLPISGSSSSGHAARPRQQPPQQQPPQQPPNDLVHQLQWQVAQQALLLQQQGHQLQQTQQQHGQMQQQLSSLQQQLGALQTLQAQQGHTLQYLHQAQQQPRPMQQEAPATLPLRRKRTASPSPSNSSSSSQKKAAATKTAAARKATAPPVLKWRKLQQRPCKRSLQ